ncbi:hypothetical protein AC1031_013793 [Aphanomyces cochlioides]|nr:hypothetical protein AC1031_013793 [Aphanomyces cochlioides]
MMVKARSITPWLLVFTCRLAGLQLTRADASTVIVADPSEADAIEQMNYDAAQASLTAQQVDQVTDDLINLNYYEYNLIPSAKPDYTIGILLDPCKTRDPGCCQDQFGSPEYIVPGSDLDDRGTVELVDEFNAPIDPRYSRLGDTPTVYDGQCHVDAQGKPFRNMTKYNADGTIGFDIDYSSLCVGEGFSVVAAINRAYPACWDHNTTVNALLPCYTFDGAQKPNCVSVGYMQTAYIVQCLGPFALDDHCGTFLELHKPGDEAILAQTRLFGEFTNGYRTTTLPLFYRGNRTRTVCNGDYEVWWVLRTRYKFVVKFQKKFAIIAPLCEFDSVANAYRGYTTLTT